MSDTKPNPNKVRSPDDEYTRLVRQTVIDMATRGTYSNVKAKHVVAWIPDGEIPHARPKVVVGARLAELARDTDLLDLYRESDLGNVYRVNKDAIDTS